MTSDEIVDGLKQIMSLQSQIDSLWAQRMADEQAISVKYQVDACNSERTNSAISYQNQIDPLKAKIKSIQDSINSAIAGS